jgi:hypothetical protein
MSLSRMRPSPAMVVALIALVAAASGSAYAALSKNSVGSKQLKKGAVKTVDIRKNAVTGKKAKESTFSTVPSAQVANSFGGMTATRVDSFTLGNGGSRTIGTFGPFTLTATCAINVLGDDTATINITTSQNNSAFVGEDEDPDFDIGDTVAYVAAFGSPTGTANIQEDGGVALAPDGTLSLHGQQLYAGVNILGQPGVCRFGGVLFVG